MVLLTFPTRQLLWRQTECTGRAVTTTKQQRPHQFARLNIPPAFFSPCVHIYPQSRPIRTASLQI